MTDNGTKLVGRAVLCPPNAWIFVAHSCLKESLRDVFKHSVVMRVKFGQSGSFLVGQSLAFNFLRSIHRAFAVCQKTAIVPVIKLREI